MENQLKANKMALLALSVIREALLTLAIDSIAFTEGPGQTSNRCTESKSQSPPVLAVHLLLP